MIKGFHRPEPLTKATLESEINSFCGHFVVHEKGRSYFDNPEILERKDRIIIQLN